MLTSRSADGAGRARGSRAPTPQIGGGGSLTKGDMRETSAPRRLIVGISGASGVIYGARLLELLRPLAVETHLVISRAAEVALAYETDLSPASVRTGADVVHAIGDIAAPISSGSFRTMG